MEFYLIFFLLAVLGMILTDRIEDEKKVIVVILFAGFTIISGTRFELGGNDYYIYRKAFEAIPDLWHLSEMSSRISEMNLVNLFEPGFLFFNSLVKTLGFNYYGFTLIESVIWYVCMYAGLKRYVGDWTIVLLVFLYKLFFYNTFISQRQALTIALFFVAMRYIQDKKPIQYYVICCIAITFHNGAILLFILYPLLQIHLNKKRLVLANVLCWTLFFLEKAGMSVFDMLTMILELVNSNSTIVIKAKIWLSLNQGLNIFHILEYMLLMILVVMYYDELIKLNRNVEFIVKIFLCLLPIFAIFSGNIVSTRFKDYFTITYGIILSYLCMIEKERLRWMVQTGTVLVCAYGYFRYLIFFDMGGLLPYVSYLSKGIPIFW